MSMIVHPYLGAEVARHELEHTPQHAGAQALGSESKQSLSLVRGKSY
jgi:hypothetical protein